MEHVGELVPVAQEAMRQDLQAMFHGAICASLPEYHHLIAGEDREGADRHRRTDRPTDETD